jgi:hypothetical protein
MASTYSTSLKLELIGNGDQSGTWGTTTNTNFGTLLEQAITGVVAITMANADVTLTSLNGASDEARNAVLVVGGTNSAIRNIIAPAVNKLYVIKNATIGGYAIVIKTSASTGVSIANGTTAIVYCDGTEFYFAVPSYASTNTASTLAFRDGSGNFAAGMITANLTGNVTGTASTVTTNANLTGAVTSSGNATSLGSFTSANLAAALTDETGSGAAVFANSPTLVTPALGTPSALVGTNITGTAAGLSIGGNLTGASPTAATQTTGTSNTTVATTAFVQTALQLLHPVGSIYTSTSSTNPGTAFGFGTWVAFGAGRVMIGNGGGFSAGATGGSADAVVVSHTHTATSSVSDPGHIHAMSPNADGYSAGNTSNSVRGPGGGAYSFSTQSATTGITVGTSISTEGVSGTNANLQPYVVVYMWNRTA